MQQSKRRGRGAGPGTLKSILDTIAPISKPRPPAPKRWAVYRVNRDLLEFDLVEGDQVAEDASGLWHWRFRDCAPPNPAWVSRRLELGHLVVTPNANLPGTTVYHAKHDCHELGIGIGEELRIRDESGKAYLSVRLFLTHLRMEGRNTDNFARYLASEGHLSLIETQG